MLTPNQFRSMLVIGLAAGLSAVLAEHFLKPGLKGTFKAK